MSSVYDIADEFIQLTDCSVFITGKAGSGKTTLLRKIKESAFKQMAIVAPTGVAAINAGGTTIHSFFQLPFSPFIPSLEGRRNLISKQQVTEIRRKVFRELELLIIDEISMVRADVLDAIDTVLRHYRFRREEPFGGVQVVYIGDMYQLPPVCVGDEWNLLKETYESPYFFHSAAVRERPPIYLELDKIFRQTNIQFINLLNQVRNNSLTDDSLALLEKRFRPGYRATEGDGYITLTTHNASADAINTDELSKIDAPYYNYSAKITGEFQEKSYPTDLELNLKLGAKVMFIANDMAQPRRYYNGKTGTVTDINSDEIWVTCDDETEPIQVGLEVWENKSYTIDRKTNRIEEKLLGTFIQYPLRLAWAITIHKSQGLTFDKVIIDAASAFASGQVYVALSRCRSLDGIILTSQIVPSSLYIDPQIIRYSESRLPHAELERQVEIFKSQYSMQLIMRLFGMEELMARTFEFVQYIRTILPDFNPETAKYIENILSHVNNLYTVAQRFLAQLRSFDPTADIMKIADRIKAASAYYTGQLEELTAMLESSPAVTESKTEAQDYTERMQSLFETASLLRFLIDGIANDFSVTHYFDVKQQFRVPKLKVKAYVVEREVTLLKTDHPTLYRTLAAWRNDYCRENDTPVYMMFGNRTLVDISNALPLSLEQLSKIKGFGKVKLQKFGEECLTIVRNYCKENGMNIAVQSNIEDIKIETDTSDNLAAGQNRTTEENKRKKNAKPKDEKINTVDATLELLKEGLSIGETATRRGLTLGTIYSHTAKLIHAGKISIDKHVNTELLHRAMNILADEPGMSNTELFERMEQKLTFDEIRLIRAHQVAIEN